MRSSALDPWVLALVPADNARGDAARVVRARAQSVANRRLRGAARELKPLVTARVPRRSASLSSMGSRPILAAARRLPPQPERAQDMRDVLDCRSRMVVTLAAAALCGSAGAQQPKLSGMWSDPPSTVLDTFCLFWCSDAGLTRLEALLDDPANDARPTVELYGEAALHQREQYVRPRLTPAALENVNLDPADDPSFLECVPWPFAREIFAPHQLKIEQIRGRVEMQYGEWNTKRTVYLDGRAAPATPRTYGALGWPLRGRRARGRDVRCARGPRPVGRGLSAAAVSVRR